MDENPYEVVDNILYVNFDNGSRYRLGSVDDYVASIERAIREESQTLLLIRDAIAVSNESNVTTQPATQGNSDE